MHTHRLAATVLACMLASGAGAQQTPSLAEAHRAYYQTQYGRSLALYETLAAAGDAEAAERAGYMRLQGGSMFGPQVERDPARARRLLTQAAEAGRLGAHFLLHMQEHAD